VKNAGLNPPVTDSGTHDGGDDQVGILTDSTASWTTDALVGQWLHNVSDKVIAIDIYGNEPIRSYGLITANTATTITATLAGGDENDWDNGDTYVIMPYEEYVDIAEDLQDDVPGIGIGNGKDISISYCKVINSGSGGISAGYARCVSLHKYSEGITIDHCISSDNPRDGINIGKYVGAVTITNNTCSNNGSPHPTDPSREYVGKGIEVSGLNKINLISGTISDNTCSDNGYQGIVLKSYSDGVTVDNNIVTGSNRDQDGAGIFFYGGKSNPIYCKNHLIKNNVATGNIRGIVAYYAQACTIEGNTITTDAGSFPVGQPGVKVDGSNNVVVNNNTISSLDGAGIVVQNTWNDVESYDNTFTGNTISGAKFAGIALWSGAHDNTFTGNTITGTTELTFWEGDETWEETQADGVFIDNDGGTGNVFNYNNIYGNDGDGMENQVTTTLVDATCNWWGAADGPSGFGPGFGDAVSDYVDFEPWLDNPWFLIDHAKLDFNKKSDDDKAHVKGRLAFNNIYCGCVDPIDGGIVTVTVGTLSETFAMEAKGKKGEKWEYKRPRHAEGNLKHIKIDWKKVNFDIRIDNADFSGLTNPVTIGVQVDGMDDCSGEQAILMKEKKSHWDYKTPKH